MLKTLELGNLINWRNLCVAKWGLPGLAPDLLPVVSSSHILWDLKKVTRKAWRWVPLKRICNSEDAIFFEECLCGDSMLDGQLRNLDESPVCKVLHYATHTDSYAYLHPVLFPKGFVAIPQPKGGQCFCTALGKPSATFRDLRTSLRAKHLGTFSH